MLADNLKRLQDMSWNETAKDQYTQLRDRFETDFPDRDFPI